MANRTKNYSNIGSRIRELRKKENLTQNELAKKVNKSESSIRMWELGKSEPDIETLQILSSIFNVPIDYITGNSTESYFDISSVSGFIPNKIKIPFIGDIACGKPIFAEEDFNGYIDVIEGVKADFCLQARGDSMINARIYDGDIVFIKKQELVHNGEIAVVLIEDEATLKRVYFYPEKQTLILKPENSNYEDMIFSNEELEKITILGKAVAFQSVIR